MKSRNLAGLVLCGGYSSRMGSDKGLLVHHDVCWVQEAVRKLETIGLPVWVSIRQEQQSAYSSAISSEKLIADTMTVQGPLAGLLTAHQHHPEQDWLVLACDMIDMTQPVLTRIIEAYQQSEEYDCFVFEYQEQWEPLCAIYRSGALQQSLSLVRKWQLESQSIKYLIAQSNTYFLSITSDFQFAFGNYNYPEDLKLKNPL